MATSLESLVERVLGELHHIVQTQTVVGEPVTAGPVTLIPVSKISMGFGAGGGEGKQHAGTGGGASVEPIGFIVVHADGKVEMMTLKEKEVSWGQLVEMVPDAVSKIKGFVDKRRGDDDEEVEPQEDDS
ncbi:MAG: sporulation protein [Gemmatimonadetes bacterium]|jgi:uncharacterized spore protein YtfJ|nr:sporulation protein [Gemmatimonadota bacterium]MBT4608620.1 sporulation protein [Gemmatimonadota bacterium]MBT5059379.1 sporulation protein [Gemmatimonadota bacterium]MBT5144136.1 sporulation protein [Gemmatimonadota bacterium]MBT5586608.1 sporulation protein [Gemmatimonadota bacterium]